MAGEVEDHTGIQTEYPTSSISFGRFEAESLSWERRSSFNHNRYLEEVEKFSTPGSVTQKKAYFEKHFKKKGLFHQASSISQNSSESQSNEHRNEDHNNKMDYYYDHSNEGIRCEELQNHENDGVQFSWYDETPVVSDDLERELTDDEGEVSPNSQTPAQQIFNSEEIAADTHFLEEEPTKAVQTQELLNTSSSSNDSHALAEEDVAMKSALCDETDVRKDVSENILEKSCSHLLKKMPESSTKLQGLAKPCMGQEKTSFSSKLPSSTRIPPGHSSGKKHIGTPRSSTRTPKKFEPAVPEQTKTEKVPLMRVSPSSSSKSKTLKREVLQNAKVEERINHSSTANSDKLTKVTNRSANRVVPQSTFQRGESASRELTNRPKRVANSIKQDLRGTGAIFNLKSNERAEKRKEFYMKLEEKLHAKEAQMGEIQAKTQEETEVQMRQFRRSLNFKASPMPSFYHEAIPRASNGKKPIVAPARSRKQEGNLSRPASTTEKGNIASLSSSTPTPASTRTEPLVFSQQDNLAFAEDGTSSSPLPEGMQDTRRESELCKKTDVGRKNTKVNPREKQGQSELKKEEKVGKASRSSSTGKVMKRMARGTLAVHVAS